MTNSKNTKNSLKSGIGTSSFHGNGGFTLVEMIVAIFIFSIVMVVAVGALVSVVEANRKAQGVKSVMNNLNFALDSMTRAIRVGTEYSCGVANCTIDGSESFSFLSTDGQNVTYSFNKESARIERTMDGGVTIQTMTAPEVTVEELRFYLAGESPSDEAQPRVLIITKGLAGPTGKTQTEFSLETMVTQRILDR